MKTPCVTLVTLVTSLTLGCGSLGAQEVYTVDDAHSLMDFTVRLVGFNRVRGSFTRYDTDIAWDPRFPERSSVAFSADVASITTANRERDEHLKSDVFFDVARFPRLTFRSTSVRVAGDTLWVSGDLTIRDSTRRVVLPVRITSALAEDPFRNQRISFTTAVTINRRDFGVVGPDFWNHAISDSVSIEIEAAGRIWNFAALNWGPQRRQSMGQLLYNAADSSRLAPALALVRQLAETRRSDSTLNFSWWEFEKAAMRLSQLQKHADALRILDLALDVHAQGAADLRSELLSRRGEVRLRLGRRADAEADLRQALVLLPANTNAMEWLSVATLPR